MLDNVDSFICDRQARPIAQRNLREWPLNSWTFIGCPHAIGKVRGKASCGVGLLQRQEHSGLHHWVGFTCEGEVVTQAGDKWGNERINDPLSSSNDQSSRYERLVRRISISFR